MSGSRSSVAEPFLSANLKVYWSPSLSSSRQRGGFSVRIYDHVETDIFSILDAKKVNYRCEEEDEG